MHDSAMALPRQTKYLPTLFLEQLKMRVLRVTTPAKVNLFLRILGRRPDGYHDLETLFQAVDLEDELIFRAAAGESTLAVPGFPLLETTDNLVFRAVRRLEELTGRKLAVNITLNKRIPVAAGLGGGSSDAAAALVGISTLFDLNLSREQLHYSALSLGADVPFFLMGGTAVGEGVGEILSPVSLPLNYELILANPGFPVSTASVFQAFSKSLTGTSRQSTLWNVLREGLRPEDLLHNDLQDIAETLHPEIREICQVIEQSGVKKALMSGSGPTVFGITSLLDVDATRKELPVEWSIVPARPLGRGMVLD